jgi:type IV secretory pathway TrbF-like protein
MSNSEIPDEFCKVLKDFVRDIKTTFPEDTELIRKNVLNTYYWRTRNY